MIAAVRKFSWMTWSASGTDRNLITLHCIVQYTCFRHTPTVAIFWDPNMEGFKKKLNDVEDRFLATSQRIAHVRTARVIWLTQFEIRREWQDDVKFALLWG